MLLLKRLSDLLNIYEDAQRDSTVSASILSTEFRSQDIIDVAQPSTIHVAPSSSKAGIQKPWTSRHPPLLALTVSPKDITPVPQEKE